MQTEVPLNSPGAQTPPDKKQPTTKETVCGCSFLILIVLLAAWLLKGCFSGSDSPTQTTHATTGISYSQMMGHGFDKLFEMKQSSDADAKTRYLGESRMGVGMLELIGDKDDLSEVALILGMPKVDSPIITENAGLLIGFLGNVDPAWSSEQRTSWFRDAVPKQSGQTSLVRGKNRITVEVLQPHGLTITVRPSK